MSVCKPDAASQQQSSMGCLGKLMLDRGLQGLWAADGLARAACTRAMRTSGGYADCCNLNPVRWSPTPTLTLTLAGYPGSRRLSTWYYDDDSFAAAAAAAPPPRLPASMHGGRRPLTWSITPPNQQGKYGYPFANAYDDAMMNPGQIQHSAKHPGLPPLVASANTE